MSGFRSPCQQRKPRQVCLSPSSRTCMARYVPGLNPQSGGSGFQNGRMLVSGLHFIRTSMHC